MNRRSAQNDKRMDVLMSLLYGAAYFLPPVSCFWEE